MSEQYKNWLKLDINELENRPLSDEKKSDIKAFVLANTKQKQKRFSMRRLTAAAIIGLSAATATSFAVPAIASQLPFIQHILNYFDEEELPETFSVLATPVNETQSNNGIDIMIEDAVYDGTNVMITYALQTDHLLGEQPQSNGWFDIKEAVGISGTGKIEKVNATTYVGVEKITPFFEGDSPETIHVQWVPQAFVNSETEEQFDGSYQFDFTLSQLPATSHALDQPDAESEGVTLSVQAAEFTEMSTVLQYEYRVDEALLKEWPFVSVEFVKTTDDLGNVYSVNGNGSISYDNGTFAESKATIYSLDPKASSITVTPEVYLSKGSGEQVEVRKMNPITIKLK